MALHRTRRGQVVTVAALITLYGPLAPAELPAGRHRPPVAQRPVRRRRWPFAAGLAQMPDLFKWCKRVIEHGEAEQ